MNEAVMKGLVKKYSTESTEGATKSTESLSKSRSTDSKSSVVVLSSTNQMKIQKDMLIIIFLHI